VFDYEADKYAIPGYQLVLQHRLNNASGGVAVYIINELYFDHKSFLFPHAEVVQIYLTKLFINSIKITLEIVCVYNESSRFSFKNFKDDLENILKGSGKCCILIGDFNINTLEKSNEGTQYDSLLAAYGFINLVNEPTRVIDNSVSCLDHVIVKNCSNLKITSTVEKLGFSDHYANIVCCCVSYSVRVAQYCKYVNYSVLNRKIQNTDWQHIYNNDGSVDNALDKFYELYNSCLEDATSLKLINNKNRHRSPWITDNLVSKTNFKNKLYKIVKMDINKHNLTLIRQYKKLSKKVTNLIRVAKMKFYSDKIEAARGDRKQYWQVVRSVLRASSAGAKRQPLTSVIVNDILYDVPGNELLIANAFNDFFINTPPALLESEFGQNFQLMPEMPFYPSNLMINYITVHDVCKLLSQMKNKKSTGPDGVSIVTIKSNLNKLAPVIKYIFNLSIKQGKFPEQLKQACVIPIFKSNEKKIMSNYRPISLINSLAKVFEKIMQKQLVKYFNMYNLFSTRQYGFLKGESTDCAIDQHIRHIVSSVDGNRPTVATYIDFSKAFDLVDRNILLFKLRCYGVTGVALSWIESFLLNRQQVVKVNGVVSQPQTSNHGVPQGGVLGPLFFVIFINDLLEKNFTPKFLLTQMISHLLLREPHINI